MEFKIDTRENYVHIALPGPHFSANMAAALEARATELAGKAGHNFLIDASACQTADAEAFECLASWHEKTYSSGNSLVITGLQPVTLSVVREAQLDGAINIAPTEVEAVDIINMEILERDLFGEES